MYRLIGIHSVWLLISLPVYNGIVHSAIKLYKLNFTFYRRIFLASLVFSNQYYLSKSFFLYHSPRGLNFLYAYNIHASTGLQIMYPCIEYRGVLISP
jgi:hypothetical protein